MTTEVNHIFVIWDKGRKDEDLILEDLGQSFELQHVIEYSIPSKYFIRNLEVLYANSLSGMDDETRGDILRNKADIIGDGAFILAIVKDQNPKWETRNTTDGKRVVNANAFDKKGYYRSLTEGGSLIHATDDEFEFRKDLGLLFGLNLQEFKIKYPESKTKVKVKRNVVGVPRWNSVHELFFALNCSSKYVVMRNFECLPDDYTVSGHGDIDLLVDNLNQVVALTHAEPVFPEQENRVHYKVNINGQKVPFDFRYVGDNYYDVNWQNDLLERRILAEDTFYRPSHRDYFYSLLYHAYVQKLEVADDYKERLEVMAKDLGVEYNRDNEVQIRLELESYMQKEGYGFTVPIDHTVLFNTKFIDIHQSAQDKLRDPKRISFNLARKGDLNFVTEVFRSEKGIIKRATDPIARNEHRFLTRMAESQFTPKVLAYEEYDSRAMVEMEFVEGQDLHESMRNRKVWNKRNVKKIVEQCLDILAELNEHKIEHRDIKPGNLIVNVSGKDVQVYLIDFGWSIDFGQEDALEPVGLNTAFGFPGPGHSDLYSMGRSVGSFLGRLQFGSKLVSELLSVQPNSLNAQEEMDLINRLRETIKTESWVVSDNFVRFIKKYRVFYKLKNKLRLIWKYKVQKA